MAARISASVIRTCFGDGPATFDALLAGRTGVGALRHPHATKLNVTAGYHIDGGDLTEPWRATRWLVECVTRALTDANVDPATERTVVLVGTGLRELPTVEGWALRDVAAPVDRLDFGPALRAAIPHLAEVVTISNACAAGGHALALAQDLVELGDADVVVAAGADSMTASMLAMVGRVAETPTDVVRPFDRDRRGVLLGEGAAAVVVTRADRGGPVVGRLVSTGLSCDALHETAPDPAGIRRAVLDALDRGGRAAEDVALVVAHGTGTALNDPTESTVLRGVFGTSPRITAVKGAVGHTSGAAALVNLDVALRSLAGGRIPPVVGLREALDEGDGLRFVRDTPAAWAGGLVAVNAFGFGGVNAVTLVEAYR